MNRAMNQGSALLVVLGGLAVMALLASTVLALSGGEARRTRATINAAEARELAAAAVHRIVAALLDPAERAAMPGDGRAIEAALLGGRVTFSIRDERGKFDLNDGLPEVLNRLLLAAGTSPRQASDIVGEWQAWRRPGEAKHRRLYATIGEFGTLPSVGATLYEQLAPDLTVHAGSATIDPYAASPALLRAATGAPEPEIAAFLASRAATYQPPPPAAFETAPFALSDGRIFGIAVEAVAAGGGRAQLEAVVGLTGDPAKPYVFPRWQ
ncbi:MAG: hypothetical protein EXQ87_11150 [Alphaproteobacteria bacterium]|nr:hypothetical protein [Alphaproteobacteria bacterium]